MTDGCRIVIHEQIGRNSPVNHSSRQMRNLPTRLKSTGKGCPVSMIADYEYPLKNRPSEFLKN
jgi:hypothetical protein